MAHIPYGYKIKNGSASLDKNNAAQVKTLFEEYAGGLSLEGAANKAGISRRHASIGKMLSDERYLGGGFYPAIISAELFNRVQEERVRRAEMLGRNRNYFADDKSNISPFWGKIFCGECGSEYRRYAEDGKEQWRCSRRIVKGRLCCASPVISEQSLEEAFMEVVCALDMEDVKARPPKKRMVIEKKYDDPLKQAEYAYSLVEADDFDYMTEKMINIMKNVPGAFDGEFMSMVVKRITVFQSGAAMFELINGKIYGKELIIVGGSKNRVGNTGKTEAE